MTRTIDREQEQARLRADTLGTKARAGRDLVWVGGGCILIACLLVATQAFQALWNWADDLTDRSLLIAVAMAAVMFIGAGIFAGLQYRYARDARATLYRLSYHDPLTGLPTDGSWATASTRCSSRRGE